MGTQTQHRAERLPAGDPVIGAATSPHTWASDPRDHLARALSISRADSDNTVVGSLVTVASTNMNRIRSLRERYDPLIDGGGPNSSNGLTTASLDVQGTTSTARSRSVSPGAVTSGTLSECDMSGNESDSSLYAGMNAHSHHQHHAGSGTPGTRNAAEQGEVRPHGHSRTCRKCKRRNSATRLSRATYMTTNTGAGFGFGGHNRSAGAGYFSPSIGVSQSLPAIPTLSFGQSSTAQALRATSRSAGAGAGFTASTNGGGFLRAGVGAGMGRHGHGSRSPGGSSADLSIEEEEEGEEKGGQEQNDWHDVIEEEEEGDGCGLGAGGRAGGHGVSLPTRPLSPRLPHLSSMGAVGSPFTRRQSARLQRQGKTAGIAQAVRECECASCMCCARTVRSTFGTPALRAP